jgi:hypothetical protein
LNPKNNKKNSKKKNLLAMDSSSLVESILDVDENIVYTSTKTYEPEKPSSQGREGGD